MKTFIEVSGKGYFNDFHINYKMLENLMKDYISGSWSDSTKDWKDVILAWEDEISDFDKGTMSYLTVNDDITDKRISEYWISSGKCDIRIATIGVIEKIVSKLGNYMLMRYPDDCKGITKTDVFFNKEITETRADVIRCLKRYGVQATKDMLEKKSHYFYAYRVGFCDIGEMSYDDFLKWEDITKSVFAELHEQVDDWKTNN
jgi:hypothetical protein